MIACSAERYGHAEPSQRWHEPMKLNCILQCPVSGQPTTEAHIPRQGSLYTSQVRIPRKPACRLHELPRIGPVLGIIDGHKCPTGPSEAIIQRAGLGLWIAGGQDQNFGSFRPYLSMDRILRCVVSGFQQQFHIKQMPRIFERHQAV